MKRPSGLTLLTFALLVLLPALAILQYQWIGQVSVAAQERMQHNVRNAADQFRDTFDGELARASAWLQAGPGTARDGASERYSNQYDTWVNTTTHPDVVESIFIVDADDGRLRVRRWNPAAHTFDAAAWPAEMSDFRPRFLDALAAFEAGRPLDWRPFLNYASLMVAPLRNPGPGPGPPGTRQPTAPVFGFTVLHLDMAYIQDQLLPELARRHFLHAEEDSYRVAVTDFDNPAAVVYQSDPDSPVDTARADVAVALFGDPSFFFSRGPDGPPRDPRRALPATSPRAADDRADVVRTTDRAEFGRWQLVVQHQHGSLEAAVARVRNRNLGISFGVLLLLTVSVSMMTGASRRAHRLARQQMEFVAGVSHELRTPVAVIRSAAENLSHGVVGSADRVKRYGEMIESEARRLGEMVERVLQYAGIEAGLGMASRAALAPADLIDTAIDSAIPLMGPDKIDIYRDIAPGLPTVIGDAAALRSAVENLIANAVKYGGRDRWVGIRAEHVGERRRREVRITVSDHGAGVPAADLPHIFEPFYRGSEAAARQVHGNGLGLSLVKRIVAAHGGRVIVATRAGAGSSFTIVLPAAAHDTQLTPVAGELRATAHS